MTGRTLLERLARDYDARRRSFREWTARCPCCGADDALHVRHTRRHGDTVRCASGCDLLLVLAAVEASHR